MRTTNEKVYRCDHCNRAIIQKGSMTLHERMCNKNPKNKHKCFEYCTHLVIERDTEVIGGSEYGEGQEITAGISFHCELNMGVELFSYKLERFKSNQHRCDKMVRMPLECKLYKVENGHDFEGCDDLPESGFRDFIFNNHPFSNTEF